MSASTGSPPGQPRVPAWKRLGLKLKYAKEDVEPRSLHGTGSNVKPSISVGNRPQTRPSNEYVRSGGRRERTPETLHDSQDLVSNGIITDSQALGGQQARADERTAGSREDLLADRSDNELQSVNDTPLEDSVSKSQKPVEDTGSKSRRKSVSFTTDTKTEDGIGASALLQQQSTEQASKPGHTESLQSQSAPNKAKKQKKRAKEAIAQTQTTGGDDRPANSSNPEYVQYLVLFHTDRPSWKFNKKKQKDLLKNLFHIERVPPELNEAILQYIAGLQSTGARQRVIERATAVLKEIAEKTRYLESQQDMESEEARRAAYSAALRCHLEKYERARVERTEYDDQQIEEMQREAERGKRAEAVLGELLWKELHPNEVLPAALALSQNSPARADITGKAATPTATTGTNTSSTSKSISKRKRRKMRTQASSSDDSSSDSDSNTSDENEGDSNSRLGPVTVHDALSPRSDPRLKNPKNQVPRPAWTPAAPPPKRKIFDDELLDQIFPKKRSYHDTAPKRKAGAGGNGAAANKKKARGFAYTHGTRADESGSEDDD